jgi:myo-inositol-hexaphosphate 3-phosphohydrolase
LALLSLCFHVSVPVPVLEPDNSYIAKIDDNSKLTVYDLNGNEVNLNVNGKYRINVVAHGSEMAAKL